jgi:tetratricopeptide (TPR) repeat protein
MRRCIAVVTFLAVVLSAGCMGSRDPAGIYRKTPTYEEAEALFIRGEFAAAREKFRVVLNSPMPQDKAWKHWTIFYMARCDQLTGHYSEAVRVYNDLLRTPKYPRLDVQALAARADINLETGNYNGAAQDYSRARSLLERNPHVFAKTGVDREKLLFGEGKALWALERYSESDLVFDRYLADYPTGRFVADAKSCHTKIGGGRRVRVNFYAQVGGLYRIKSQAENLAEKLRGKGFANVKVVRRTSASGFVYAVTVGAFETRQEAHGQKQLLETAGFRPVQVRP